MLQALEITILNKRMGVWEIFQLPPAQSCISVPAGERDSSHGDSSIASAIHGPNTTALSLLKNSQVADITQCVSSTPSATQRWSINTPTAILGSPAPGGISQRDSMHPIVLSPFFGIASTPTLLSGLQNLPTPISDPKAHAIISKALQT